MSKQRVDVEVHNDFVARQTRATPINALSEIIWNSLDGDSGLVAVEFELNDLANGLSKIVVSDDGLGFSHAEALEYFKRLGGSWKRASRLTKKHHRNVHGQEGRGRYKALALGRVVTWKVCFADDGGEKYAFQIELSESDYKGVSVTDPEPAPGRQTGVIVVIEDVRANFAALQTENGKQDLTEIFAPYLINYRDVSIKLNGEVLDADTAIAEEHEFQLTPITSESGEEFTAVLQVIEWNQHSSRALYLCTEDGFPVDQVDTRFHVGPYYFSAYLKSKYIENLDIVGATGLAELDKRLIPLVDEARGKIKAHFREKAAEKAKSVVDEWKKEKTYPYEGEPQSPIDTAERQVFDIVAVSLQNASSDLEQAPTQSRALHLRMLRHAIERSPSELQKILSEVVQLPKRKQKELADLLKETSLSAVITAAKTVSDRLNFLAGLECIVFDPEKRDKLKERSQLHKILAENTWIFGEEYNLWVSDRDLRRVLVNHKKYLNADVVIDDPVKVVGKKRGIVDLVFSKQVRRHKASDIENLVVELKAPKVVLGSDEVTQIKRYAQAVANDERFHAVKGVKWHFWLLSNSYDELVQQDIEGGPDPDRRLIIRDEKRNVQVGIKTWAELIEENRSRLQFFQEHLQHNASESDALEFLRERHAEFLEGVVVEPEEVHNNGDMAADTVGEEE